MLGNTVNDSRIALFYYLDFVSRLIVKIEEVLENNSLPVNLPVIYLHTSLVEKQLRIYNIFKKAEQLSLIM